MVLLLSTVCGQNCFCSTITRLNNPWPSTALRNTTARQQQAVASTAASQNLPMSTSNVGQPPEKSDVGDHVHAISDETAPGREGITPSVALRREEITISLLRQCPRNRGHRIDTKVSLLNAILRPSLLGSNTTEQHRQEEPGAEDVNVGREQWVSQSCSRSCGLSPSHKVSVVRWCMCACERGWLVSSPPRSTLSLAGGLHEC